MDASEFDVGGEESAPADKLAFLHESLNEVIALTEVVAQMEDDLKQAKSALHRYRTVQVPDIMSELQMDRVSFKGWDVRLDDFVSGSLPSDPEKRASAIKWLESHDGGGLIKTDIKLSFAKSQHNEALSIAAQLESDGFAPNVESGVHPSTLQSYARQRIKDGDDIDPEALGLFIGKVAKLKEVKK
jgi:hypothetical protein